jgi:hypothetical protein
MAVSDDIPKTRGTQMMMDLMKSDVEWRPERALKRIRLVGQMVPHCDCEESNRAAGLIKARMNQRRDDADDAWTMVPVELGPKGTCQHCNYIPFYMEEVEDV